MLEIHTNKCLFILKGFELLTVSVNLKDLETFQCV